jgi:hypothetical protein
MGIRFSCFQCQYAFNIKDALAGKRSKCPRCGVALRIPHQDQPMAERIDDALVAQSSASDPSDDEGQHVGNLRGAGASVATKVLAAPDVVPKLRLGARSTSGADDPIRAFPESVWYVRPLTGGQFGPATSEVMQQWLDEGRVPVRGHVWQEGWPQWRVAGEVFPWLQDQQPDMATNGAPPSQPIIAASPRGQVATPSNPRLFVTAGNGGTAGTDSSAGPSRVSSEGMVGIRPPSELSTSLSLQRKRRKQQRMLIVSALIVLCLSLVAALALILFNGWTLPRAN